MLEFALSTRLNLKKDPYNATLTRGRAQGSTQDGARLCKAHPEKAIKDSPRKLSPTLTQR
jgi:hypothetical protein